MKNSLHDDAHIHTNTCAESAQVQDNQKQEQKRIANTQAFIVALEDLKNKKDYDETAYGFFVFRELSRLGFQISDKDRFTAQSREQIQETLQELIDQLEASKNPVPTLTSSVDSQVEKTLQQ